SPTAASQAQCQVQCIALHHPARDVRAYRASRSTVFHSTNSLRRCMRRRTVRTFRFLCLDQYPDREGGLDGDCKPALTVGLPAHWLLDAALKVSSKIASHCSRTCFHEERSASRRPLAESFAASAGSFSNRRMASTICSSSSSAVSNPVSPSVSRSPIPPTLV